MHQGDCARLLEHLTKMLVVGSVYGEVKSLASCSNNGVSLWNLIQEPKTGVLCNFSLSLLDFNSIDIRVDFLICCHTSSVHQNVGMGLL